MDFKDGPEYTASHGPHARPRASVRKEKNSDGENRIINK
jgi:hypothetical protein